MKKSKKLYNNLMKPDASLQSKKISVLRELSDDSRECKLCGGVNDRNCNICED